LFFRQLKLSRSAARYRSCPAEATGPVTLLRLKLPSLSSGPEGGPPGGPGDEVCYNSYISLL